MRFKIWGTYQGNKELVYETISITDALYLQKKYRIAYGSDWTIEVEDIYDDKKTL